MSSLSGGMNKICLLMPHRPAKKFEGATIDFLSETKICFIIGVDNRSGTNFTFKLLREHPQCTGPGPIWEDKFLFFSGKLRNYVNVQYRSWNRRWAVDKKIGGQEILLRHLGNSIEDFLKLQITKSAAKPNTSGQNPAESDPPKILLTKSPKPRGIDNFFDLFPNAYLVLLIRDGRAVVESGVRTFGWNYEDAMQRWRNNAQIIIDFEEKYKGMHKNYILLKYEDLVINQENSLIKVFNFLGLDPELFDFDKARSLGVSGSSDLRKGGGDVHWVPTGKNPDFNPLSRFSNWDRKRHARFNWIAEKQMNKFGYTLNTVKGNRQLYVIKNKIIDFIMTLKPKPPKKTSRKATVTQKTG